MKIELDTLSDEQLDKLLKISSIAKINKEIEAMKNDHELKMADLYAKIESMSYHNAKLEAERRKFEKELKWHPWTSAGITAVLVFILGLFAKWLGVA